MYKALQIVCLRILAVVSCKCEDRQVPRDMRQASPMQSELPTCQGCHCQLVQRCAQDICSLLSLAFPLPVS